MVVVVVVVLGELLRCPGLCSEAPVGLRGALGLRGCTACPAP